MPSKRKENPAVHPGLKSLLPAAEEVWRLYQNRKLPFTKQEVSTIIENPPQPSLIERNLGAVTPLKPVPFSSKSAIGDGDKPKQIFWRDQCWTLLENCDHLQLSTEEGALLGRLIVENPIHLYSEDFTVVERLKTRHRQTWHKRK